MPKLPRFAVGDCVTFTNDYGLVFPGKTVAGIDLINGQPRYYQTPTDTPWYAYNERNLKRASKDAGPAAGAGLPNAPHKSRC